MRSIIDDRKFIINKCIELIKFIFILGLLCFLVIKLPNQTSEIVKYVGMFILGGSKLRSKLGL